MPAARAVTAAIRSELEGAKLGASVLFLDLGITDAITDKHRLYQSQVLLACGSVRSGASRPSRPLRRDGAISIPTFIPTRARGWLGLR